MKKITVWARWDEQTHNHIEDGHSNEDAPAANSPDQKKTGGKVFAWKKKHCFLDDDDKVVNCGSWIY